MRGRQGAQRARVSQGRLRSGSRRVIPIVGVPSRARKAFAPLPFALSLTCGVPPPPATIGTVAIDVRSTPDTAPGASFDVGIRFDAAPNLVPFEDDRLVVLHVLDDAGEVLWTDEHEPPVPTSAWRPGGTVHYTRSVRVPASPYFGPATIAVGLDLPGSDVLLLPARLNGSDLAYATAALTLDPPADRSLITFEEGWYRMEFNRRNGREWRWTAGRADFSFPNPRRGVTLHAVVQGRAARFEFPQRLTLVNGERTLGETTLNTNRRVALGYVLTPDELGDDDIVRLALVTDQTFRPQGRDNDADVRELGVRVFELFVEARSE